MDQEEHRKQILQDWNLGFPIPDKNFHPILNELSQRWEPTIKNKIKSQEKRFNQFLSKHTLTSSDDTKLVKKLIRKGIPSIHRPQFYFVLSGAEKLMKQHPNYYQELHIKIKALQENGYQPFAKETSQQASTTTIINTTKLRENIGENIGKIKSKTELDKSKREINEKEYPLVDKEEEEEEEDIILEKEEVKEILPVKETLKVKELNENQTNEKQKKIQRKKSKRRIFSPFPTRSAGKKDEPKRSSKREEDHEEEESRKKVKRRIFSPFPTRSSGRTRSRKGERSKRAAKGEEEDEEEDDEMIHNRNPPRPIDDDSVDSTNENDCKRFLTATRAIEADTPRTYPQHPYFQIEEHRNMLDRILKAYAYHSNSVAYCQGMNFVAGMVLLVMNDEEKAFWVLHCIISSYLPRDMYSDQMQGLFCEASVLQRLLEERRPKFCKHLCEVIPHFEVFCTQWFLALYCHTMPVETTLRIWDAFLFESYKILYRVALTILMLLEPQLMSAQDMGGMVPLLQESPHTLYDCRSFMKRAFKIRRFRRSTIQKYRQQWWETNGAVLQQTNLNRSAPSDDASSQPNALHDEDNQVDKNE